MFLDSENSVSIFNDPVFDISKFIDGIYSHEKTVNISNALRASWLDYRFKDIRELGVYVKDRWSPEEECLLNKLYQIIGNEEFDKRIGSLFLMISGRPSETIGFVTDFPRKSPKITPQTDPDEHGMLWYSPSLFFRSLKTMEDFPLMQWSIIDHRKSRISRKTVSGSSSIEDIVNENEGGPYESKGIIEIFPCGNNDKWVRVSCGEFLLSFGNDITNGKGIKYPWINTIDSEYPPTLSKQGEPEVMWIENDPPGYITEFSYELQCPIQYPSSFKENTKEIIQTDIDYGNLGLELIWIDPDTGRINETDLAEINKEEKEFIIVECNSKSSCKGTCDYCFMRKGTNPNLALFRSEEKGWGVVATANIEAGSYISDYSGKPVEVSFENENCMLVYSVEYGDTLGVYGYDAETMCNIGRFINFSHGSPTNCASEYSQPNAKPIKVLCSRLDNVRFGIFSLRKIFAGEEITTFYGPHYEKGDFICGCNVCMRGEAPKRKYKKANI